MSNYIDLSKWNPESIDFSQYIPWSKSIDGISRLALRSSQGIGVPDSLYPAMQSKAVAAGIEELIHYHMTYPWLHPGTTGAEEEAKSFVEIVGTRLRLVDYLMCDAESVKGQSGYGSWYFDFLEAVARLSNHPKDHICIYANPAYIAAHLQDSRLAEYGLILARWTFNANSRPLAPAPFKSYLALQYSDRGRVPGLPNEIVDLDIFLHQDKQPEAAPIPEPVHIPESTTTEYKVQPGDSLWTIAEKQLGNATRWTEIYEENRGEIGSNPDYLRIGMVLRIPKEA